MKLKFYDNHKLAKKEIYIGKSGQIRFKQDTVKEFNINKGQRWAIATDEEEAKSIKHLYLIRTSETDNDGFKVSFGNSTHHINARGVLKLLNISIPVRCKYEPFEFEGYTGIKLIL